MMNQRLIFLAPLSAALLAAAAGRAGADDLFREGVAPLLQRRCLSCHCDEERQGDLSLATAEELLDRGHLVPGDAGASYLLELVTPGESRAAMPRNGDPLSADERDAIRRWIDAGAPWPEGERLQPAVVRDLDWWSLRPLVAPEIPPVLSSRAESDSADSPDSDPRNPIDRFLAEKLAAAGWTFSPPASKTVYLRRLTFDLTGLPPTPQELEDYLRDEAPDADQRLIDRLLASPHYGERWARHWLDVAHYGDTHGYDKDKPRPHAWPYRDYVIRAMNEDRPWSRFLQEQIAGDVLFPDAADGLEALGLLAAGPWDFVGHAEVMESTRDGRIARHLDRDDMVRTVIGAFNSLTVGCAQCHHHKFDPITQEDYYSLHAVFAAIDRADRPYYRDQPATTLRQYEELTRRKARVERRIGLLRAKRAAAESEQTKPDSADPDPQPPDPTQPDAAAVSGDRPPLLPSVSASPDVADRAPAAESSPSGNDAAEATLQALEAELAELVARLMAFPPPQLVYSGTVHTGKPPFVGRGHVDGAPRPIHVLYRGDVDAPRQPAVPGSLSLFPDLPARFELPEGHTEGQRRAALAEWLSSRNNPLTWRSVVNRVWQHHFGAGLVETPDDFGRMGAQPTHPELLDWLAADFRDNGQSLKSLHRMIVSSRAYRQSSLAADRQAAAQDGDPENRLLWRMNRRKLDAEAVRDAVLAVSGGLDRSQGGPAFQDFVIERPEHSPHYQYHLHDPRDPATHRRAVYRFIVRSQLQPFMNSLDCADPSQQVGRRNSSVTAQQALAMLNNGLILAMSQRFADRLRDEAGSPAEQAALGVRLALGREATEAETGLLTEFLQESGLENYCRLLFNLSEFSFID